MIESKWLTHGAPKKVSKTLDRACNKLRQCDKCASIAAPEHGVEYNGNRWMCFNCWKKKLGLRK